MASSVLPPGALDGSRYKMAARKLAIRYDFVGFFL